MVKPFGDPKAAFLALALLFAFGMAAVQPGRAELQPWTELGPWSSPLSAAEVAISWQAKGPALGIVRYGASADWQKTGELPYSVATPEPAKLAHVTISGLIPGTRYAYRVKLGAEVSPISYFSTPPEKFQPFTFLVYGDTRTNYDRHAMVAERMAKESAEFVVHVGDLIESPTQAEWHAFLKSGEPLLRAMSFLCVIGNHERNSRTYYDLFTLPQGGGRADKEWWALFWGDVLLVGLDSNLGYLKFTGLKEQMDWLKELLSQEARYKFVFFHHPLFSSDPYYGGNESLAKLWHRVFLEAGVTAVFCGHCHNYEHLVRDGLHYFVTGGGGAPLSPLSDTRSEGSVLGIENVLHYLRVSVSEGKVVVEMVPVAEVQAGEVTVLSGAPMETTELSKTACGVGIP